MLPQPGGGRINPDSRSGFGASATEYLSQRLSISLATRWARWPYENRYQFQAKGRSYGWTDKMADVCGNKIMVIYAFLLFTLLDKPSENQKCRRRRRVCRDHGRGLEGTHIAGVVFQADNSRVTGRYGVFRVVCNGAMTIGEHVFNKEILFSDIVDDKSGLYGNVIFLGSHVHEGLRESDVGGRCMFENIFRLLSSVVVSEYSKGKGGDGHSQ